jgi:hypothetical protein
MQWQKTSEELPPNAQVVVMMIEDGHPDNSWNTNGYSLGCYYADQNKWSAYGGRIFSSSQWLSAPPDFWMSMG